MRNLEFRLKVTQKFSKVKMQCS